MYADPKTCDPIPVPKNETEIPSITTDEIYARVNKMKKDKKPGIDDICAEFLQAGGEPMMKIFKSLFDHILRTGIIPSNFKKALIVVLYKKDDRSEC